MSTKELVGKLSEQLGVSKKEAKAYLNAFKDIVKAELKSGGKVVVYSLGTFMTYENKKGVTVPKFKTSKAFKAEFK